MPRRLRALAVFLAFAIGLLIEPAAQAPPADTLLEAFRWREIGNANQRGRISSIDALDDDWTHVVVGTASGGVFKSVNGGTRWTPIFDKYGAASIGDVRIFQKDPNIIWVGTGEECGRNSATWGNGVYKSTDGGKTFQHMGLADTYTIGSIVTHPTDPNIVYVAALGNIWAPIGNRGLYKSIDGGKTWNKLSAGLPAEDKRTGALYIVMHPTDPETLWVSFWGRDRTPYRLTSGSPNGGIFKTTNGGKSFQKLTKGLPEGESGKIGLAVSRSNPRVLMAHYEHGYQPARDSAEYKDLSKPGSGIFRSEDGGASWSLVNRYFSRPFYYNHVAISPLDDKLTFHYNQNLQYSTDGGRTLQPFAENGGGHCWHAIWMDPHNKKRFYTGSDGGVTLTHDSGQTWVGSKNLNVTQYYMLGVDMRDPYYVCGGLQDAGTSCGPSMTRANGIYLNEWYSIQGGDGYHIQVDPTDWRTVYSGQDPRNVGTEVSRTDVVTRLRLDIRPHKGVNIANYDQYITPQIEADQLKKGWGEIPKPGETFNYRTAGGGAFRWNWETPIVLSPFGTPRALYVGANHLFRTDNRGAQAVLYQHVADSFRALCGQTVIILHCPNAIRMPCHLHFNCLAPGHLGQEGGESGTRAWDNSRTLFKEIEGKTERWGGLCRQCLCKGPCDVCLAQCVFLDTTPGIDGGRPAWRVQDSSTLWPCDGHRTHFSILSWEQHDEFLPGAACTQQRYIDQSRVPEHACGLVLLVWCHSFPGLPALGIGFLLLDLYEETRPSHP